MSLIEMILSVLQLFESITSAEHSLVFLSIFRQCKKSCQFSSQGEIDFSVRLQKCWTFVGTLLAEGA